ncbi:MAG: type IX secretion system membrane protein PorP/SprF [Mangrovibacterium sp.]
MKTLIHHDILSSLRIRNFILILLLIGSLKGHAQINVGQVGRYYTEPVFTQYMSGMQLLNPAYVGMWDRVGVQFFTRQDYAGQNGAPMMLYFSGYKPVVNKKNGAGINISYERVGYENKLTFTGDYAYEAKINWKTYLRLGLKVGFLNYDNYLSKYVTDLGMQVPDEALLIDINQNFMLKWGVGLIWYTPEYYVGLSIPQIVKNDYRADITNFSSIADTRDIYIMGGYFFGKQQQVRFKPTLKYRLGFGENATSALDLGINAMFWNSFWLGGMYRTDGTCAVVAQFMIIKNTTIGYALELPLGTDLGAQLQSHEIRIVFEYDFFKRENLRQAFF